MLTKIFTADDNGNDENTPIFINIDRINSIAQRKDGRWNIIIGEFIYLVSSKYAEPIIEYCIDPYLNFEEDGD
jgi:hypothetical protein